MDGEWTGLDSTDSKFLYATQLDGVTRAFLDVKLLSGLETVCIERGKNKFTTLGIPKLGASHMVVFFVSFA